MNQALPSFEATDRSPVISPGSSGIEIVLRGGPVPASVIVHGSYRVLAQDRAALGPGSVRPKIWLVAIGRGSRVTWLGRPGGEAPVFADDEGLAEGTAEGWFNVSLGQCCKLPARFVGTLDVTPVLGPWKGTPVSLELG